MALERLQFQEQFARALYQGLGRAILYAQAHSVDAYSEAIVTACLYNPVFDEQICADRASYLAELIAATAKEASYRRAILAALEDPDPDMDEDQLCDFAVIFARNGDTAARQALYERFAENADCGATTGYMQIIELDGAEGLLQVVRTFGAALRRAVSFDDDAFPEYLLRDLEPLLKDGVLADPDISAFQQRAMPGIARTQAAKADRERRRRLLANLGQFTYAQLRHYTETGDLSGRDRTDWGVAAPEAELVSAANDLVTATDPSVQRRLLTIFHGRSFPLDYRALLPMLYSPDRYFAVSAANALGRIRHAAVRALALDLIAAPDRRDYGLRLLAGNLAPSDYGMLEALVIAEQDDDALHNLTWCVKESFARHPWPEATGVLQLLFERGPCDLCRKQIVKDLIALGPLHVPIAAECRYDANAGTRALVR
jgi:hypothetical protein